MSSTFIRHIFEEEFAAAEQREATLQQSLQQMVEETVLVRFPEVPARLFHRIHHLSEPTSLQMLHRGLLHATTQAEAERLLAQIDAE